MKISGDALAAKLESALGAGAVETAAAATAAHAVDGKTPELICYPSAPEQVSAALPICAEADAAIVPWGGGTSMRLGNVVRRVDVVIALEKMAGLSEHDDANLTATVQAGMRVAALQRRLAARGQFLPVDPPHPERATIGGMVAANVNGPRRTMYGGVRDLVVGMKMVRVDGTRIKTGGKVVKNVAGYDLAKLFIGSLGTLGIVTEATFRMAPLPERAASFVASGTPDGCARLIDELSSSPLLPSAVAQLGPGAGEFSRAGSAAVAVWVEGFEEAVARHLRDLLALARGAALAGEILEDESHRRLWEGIGDFGSGETAVLYKVTAPPGSVAAILTALDSMGERGGRLSYVAHPIAGTVFASAAGDRAGVERFPALVELARSHQGHAVLAAAPAALKTGIDVWGPVPPALGLMREIKRRFDPAALLSPGRFIAGL